MRMAPTLRTLVVNAFFITYFILSLDVMGVFFQANYYGQNWGTHWEHGDDVKEPPVAYRLLIPNLVYLTRTITPTVLKETVQPSLIAFRETLYKEALLGLSPQRMWEGVRPYPQTLSDDRIVGTAIYFLVVFGSLLAFIAMLYTLARALFPNSLSYALLAPVVSLLTMVPISRSYAYYYDFSSMFFTCACLYLLLKHRWKSYVICLLIGVYNEETVLLITIFYFIYFYSSLPRRDYIILGVLQVVLGIGLEILIRYITVHDVFMYAMRGMTLWTDGRKGGELWWVESVEFLFSHDMTDLIHMTFLGVVLSYHWMDKPEFLRVAGWVVLAATGLFLTVCNPGEYRDLYSVLPILVLMATHSLVRISGADTFQFLKPESYIESNNDNGVTA